MQVLATIAKTFLFAIPKTVTMLNCTWEGRGKLAALPVEQQDDWKEVLRYLQVKMKGDEDEGHKEVDLRTSSILLAFCQ